MCDSMEFGECLKKLLAALDISGSKLAKALNVDPSLISKWVNCKKIPSYESSYIESIAEYIEKSILNSFQELKIDKVVNSIAEAEILQNKGIQIKEKIKYVLFQTQGYSIENKLNEKIPIQSSGATRFINRPEIEIPAKNDIRKKLSKKPGVTSQIPLTTSNSLIIGCREVLYAALSLFEEAAKTSPSSKGTIFITYNTDMSLLPFFDEFYLKWRKALIKVLSNGWEVNALIRLNGNLDRTLRLINDIQAYIEAGRFMPYYTNKYDSFMSGRELVVVPGIGALEFLSTRLNNQPDSAFYFRDSAAINIFIKNCIQMMSFGVPLVERCGLWENIEYPKIITKFDEIPSNRYLWKDGASSLSISLDLYQRYLKMSRRSSDEIDKLTEYHKRRLESFNSMLKCYKYKNIFTKESIEGMVRRGKYSINELYLIGKYKATPLDVVDNLKNMVHLLEKNDNYEIALVDKKAFHDEISLHWVVKEQKEVIFHMKDKRNSSALYNNPEDMLNSVIIREPAIVKAFEEKFLNIWNHIIPQNKDKREVILWLNNQIKILSESHNI